MPPRFVHSCLRSARTVGSWAATGALWSLWLGLAALLAVQIYLASNRQLELPGFAVREIEERLAASGMHAEFGRTVFDPSGRILIEDVRVMVAPFDEPVLTAGSVYARVDPWALITGRFEPLAWRVTGLSLRVPAMLSASGRTEEIVSDLDASAQPDPGTVRLDYLNCRLGNLALAARGVFPLGGTRPGRAAPLPFAEELARNFKLFTRAFGPAIQRLGAFDRPVLSMRLVPGEGGRTFAVLGFLADGLNVPEYPGYQAAGLQAECSVEVPATWPSPLEVDASAEDVHVPLDGSIHGVRIRLRGFLRATPLRLEAREADVEISAAQIRGLPVGAVYAILVPGPLPKVRVEASGWLMDRPMSVGLDADLGSRTANVRFDGEIAPEFVDYAAALTGRKLRPIVDPAGPVIVSGGADFQPGWRLGRVSARVSAHGLKVRGVVLDDASGRVDYDGRHLTAPEAAVRAGEDFAQGSYEQDMATRDYRFLLEGRLRPLDISPWFPRWWKALFGNFSFPSGAPGASVDLQGRWAEGRRTSAFVQVDSSNPMVRGAAFDRIRTRLFIRPAFTDGLEVLAWRGSGKATATFTRRLTPGPGGASQRIGFEGTSTLDPHDVASILGPTGPAMAARLAFDRTPAVTVRGRYESSKAPDAPPAAAHVEVRVEGPFQLLNWPLDNVAFAADLRGSDLRVDPFTATIAGGSANGRLSIEGKDPSRRVAFSAECKGGSLAQAVVATEGFIARRKGAKPLAATAFMKEKASVRFDMNVSAEGLYGNPYSYHGDGRASMEGAELGEVRVLGLLSELIRFTSLRFTSARGNFRVDGRQLVFSDVSVTGANSGIEAHGSYSLDRHELDFKAKIYPFKQSRLLPEMLVGAVLTPLSDVFEVKLTGSVANPTWMLAKGPSNLLHNLEQSPQAPQKAPAVPAAPASGRK